MHYEIRLTESYNFHYGRTMIMVLCCKWKLDILEMVTLICKLVDFLIRDNLLSMEYIG